MVIPYTPFQGPPDARTISAHILVVDDEPLNVEYLKRVLARDGFQRVEGTSDASDAIRSFRDARPDLVVADLHMTPVNGMDMLQAMRLLAPADEYLPIVFVSGDLTPQARRAALAAGATDFLTKPFDAGEVVLRIRGLLLTRFFYLDLQRHNESLERSVVARTVELEASHREIFERLCRVASYRDDCTSEHTKRVGLVSEQVALALGISSTIARDIGMAAELHDIGKIGVPDEILYKPGRLTPDEMARMREHAAIGADALRGSGSTLLQLAEQIALEHHERWDGEGYPQRLRGEGISIAARIVAVVDVFDALAHDRPYRAAWPMPRVLEEIAAGAGSHFDPAIVAAMLAMLESHTPAIELVA
ncbi:MAG: response regulator [Gemmatimonadaceae bacterium]|nr:response regulator [Gemmatimonadaceae bacterium]